MIGYGCERFTAMRDLEHERTSPVNCIIPLAPTPHT